MSAVLTNPDAGTPEATESRRLRQIAARAKQATRLAELMQARSIRSRVRICTSWEILTELNNLISAIDCDPGSDVEKYKLQLLEVATDLDGVLVTEESGTEPRGEYDSLTVGVRNSTFGG